MMTFSVFLFISWHFLRSWSDTTFGGGKQSNLLVMKYKPTPPAMNTLLFCAFACVLVNEVPAAKHKHLDHIQRWY